MYKYKIKMSYTTFPKDSLYPLFKIAGDYTDLILIYLLLDGFDDTSKIRVLYDAIEKNDVTVANIILSGTKGKINIDSQINSSNCFLRAIELGDRLMVDLLLRNGADINFQNKSGASALMIAAEKANYDLVIYLLKHGANPFLEDNNKVTALMLAAVRCSICTVEIIVHIFYNFKDKLDVFINQKDKDETSALMLAASNLNLQSVKTLIEAGANINDYDDDGMTPLILAAQYDDAEKVLKYLLENGADINIKNNYGETALMKAKEWDNSGAIKILRRFGIKNLHK